MHDLDAYRCAKVLLDHYGPAAADVHASSMVEMFDVVGAEPGRVIWLRILAALDDMTRTEREPGVALQ